MRKVKSLRFGLLTLSIALISVVGLVACTRSASGPIPTVASQTQVAQAVTLTPGTGVTVVAADATPTVAPEATVTGTLPSMTPTLTPTTSTEPGDGTSPTATPTTEDGEDASPTATPTPVNTSDGSEFEYTVQTGDTLWGLAIRFGTTVDALRAKNSLGSDVIYKDQKLLIPGTPTGDTVTHTVQPGETLYRIAQKYNTTVDAIAVANSIINPSYVYAGQELIIPQGNTTAPDSGGTYHIVQPGENLLGIAFMYDTTPQEIAAHNNISNVNYIYAGQTLRIP